MKTIICSTIDLEDPEYEGDGDPDMWVLCPFCKKMHVVTGDPYCSYGSFQIDSTECGYMGIEDIDKISFADATAFADLDILLELRGFDNDQELFWHTCILAEFTHYNKMQDYTDYTSEEFKELEKLHLSGNTVWVEFKPHLYCLTEKQTYNQTFLTTLGEFHFGFD